MVQPSHEVRQPGLKHKHELGLRPLSSPPAYGASVPPAYLPAENKMARKLTMIKRAIVSGL
ncbi:uncharacterized protein BO87DRAFT_88730 [Aspergillus neoniger CBS 115656]|uniref:Uncharacterized protein n=1 Tax=Aspergillus neoniger (strain CBS 115656) TaxID=1448310 RepID=A0A318YG49_ASPNB|nr:hypothetical protein BO87DRAFT_88730 [Aspergillus neoniger CBS 115656]PYH33405.1 hypothetical protein BO87DRAFT_88730 [Aspergillus neoniger CBS 115656]